MPGVVQGMLSGFSRALSEHQGQQARQQEGERSRQMDVLNTLLGSNNPEMQRLAISAMTELATKPGKRSKGLQGFLGGREESNALDPIMELLQRMETQQGGGGQQGGGPTGAPPGPARYREQPLGADAPETPAALPGTSLVEGQQAGQAGGQPQTPPSLFGGPSRREEAAGMRADTRQEEAAAQAAQIAQLQAAGASEEEIRRYLLGGGPLAPGTEPRPQAGKEMQIQYADGSQYYALVDPTDGRVIENLRPVPPEEAKRVRGMLVTADGRVSIVDPFTTRGDLGEAPERTPVDTAAWRNNQVILERVRERAQAEIPFEYEWNPEKYREVQDRIAREMGKTLEELESTPRVSGGAAPGGGGLEEPPFQSSGLQLPPGGRGADPGRQQRQLTDPEEILRKADAGEPLTPEELQIVQKMYTGLGKHRASQQAARQRTDYPGGQGFVP